MWKQGCRVSGPVRGLRRVLLWSLWVTSSCLALSGVRAARAHGAHTPRMVFTDGGTKVQFPSHGAPLRILPGDHPFVLTTFGRRHLNFYNFNILKTSVERTIQWRTCGDDNCNYNITMVEHEGNSNTVFVCGSNGRTTLCCNLSVSQMSGVCGPSEDIQSIGDSIKDFVMGEGEHSVLVETSHSSKDLFLTFSGSQDYVGIYKFGRNRVMPVSQNREQHFTGLVLSRREDPTQDRVYAFYKERNRNGALDRTIWSSYVSQVCTNDVGGPKNLLQSRWTSKMNARLFCGQHGQHFSELVDTATVHSDKWENTTVYALFRNEWGMNAVCVYNIQDIFNVFMESPVKSTDNPMNRPRTCVNDSTKISPEILRMLDKTSEMEEWVFPVNKFTPFNHYNYTHICVDNSQRKRNSKCTVVFLALNNGRIHKVVHCISYSSIVAEYTPFSHTTHIVNMDLHPPSRKLYVSSRHELVQLDVANCSQYGSTKEDCILSNDPDCGWLNGSCTSDTRDTETDEAPFVQDTIFPSTQEIHHPKREPGPAVSVTLQPRSRYFLTCPVSSRHARYTWENHRNSTPCSLKEDQCVFLIDSMSSELEGIHRCVSEEKGYRKVLVQYSLMLENRAPSLQSGSVLWLSVLWLSVHDASH